MRKKAAELAQNPRMIFQSNTRTALATTALLYPVVVCRQYYKNMESFAITHPLIHTWVPFETSADVVDILAAFKAGASAMQMQCRRPWMSD